MVTVVVISKCMCKLTWLCVLLWNSYKLLIGRGLFSLAFKLYFVVMAMVAVGSTCVENFTVLCISITLCWVKTCNYCLLPFDQHVRFCSGGLYVCADYHC